MPRRPFALIAGLFLGHANSHSQFEIGLSGLRYRKEVYGLIGVYIAIGLIVESTVAKQEKIAA